MVGFCFLPLAAGMVIQHSYCMFFFLSCSSTEGKTMMHFGIYRYIMSHEDLIDLGVLYIHARCPFQSRREKSFATTASYRHLLAAREPPLMTSGLLLLCFWPSFSSRRDHMIELCGKFIRGQVMPGLGVPDIRPIPLGFNTSPCRDDGHALYHISSLASSAALASVIICTERAYYIYRPFGPPSAVCKS